MKGRATEGREDRRCDHQRMSLSGRGKGRVMDTGHVIELFTLVPGVEKQRQHIETVDVHFPVSIIDLSCKASLTATREQPRVHVNATTGSLSLPVSFIASFLCSFPFLCIQYKTTRPLSLSLPFLILLPLPFIQYL